MAVLQSIQVKFPAVRDSRASRVRARFLARSSGGPSCKPVGPTSPPNPVQNGKRSDEELLGLQNRECSPINVFEPGGVRLFSPCAAACAGSSHLRLGWRAGGRVLRVLLGGPA